MPIDDFFHLKIVGTTDRNDFKVGPVDIGIYAQPSVYSPGFERAIGPHLILCGYQTGRLMQMCFVVGLLLIRKRPSALSHDCLNVVAAVDGSLKSSPYSVGWEMVPCLVCMCAQEDNHFAYGEAPYNPPESSGVSASFRLAFCWLTGSVELLLV